MGNRMRDLISGFMWLLFIGLVVLLVLFAFAHKTWMAWFWPGWFTVLVILVGILLITLLMDTGWIFWLGVALIVALAVLDGANVPHFNWFVWPEHPLSAYVCKDANGNPVPSIRTKDGCIAYLQSSNHVAAPPQESTQAPQQATANATTSVPATMAASTQVASAQTGCQVDDLGMTSGSGTNRYEVGGNGPQLWEYEPVVITNGEPKTLPAVWFITPAMAPDATHPHIEGAAAHVWQADPAGDCSNFDWAGFARKNADPNMSNSGTIIDARSNPPTVIDNGQMSQQDADQVASQLGQAIGQP